MGVRGVEALLAVVMAARGSSFIFSKLLLEEIGSFTVLALRFGIAFLLLCVIFWRRLWRASGRVWLAGAIVGLAYFVVMSLEMTALSMADTGPVALVEHTAIVMVPLATAMLARRKPDPLWLGAGALTTFGVGLLTVPGGHISAGLIVALGGAVAYTVTIIITDRITPDTESGLAIGIIQLGVLGVLAGVTALWFESPALPTGGTQWAMMAMLVIVCTAFGFTLQPVAQARVCAERTGLLAALNPAVASVLGAVVLGERFNWLGGLGFVLVLIGITLPYLIKNSRS